MAVSGAFPDGCRVAVTSAWLGGTGYDLRLADVLDQYGWKGTFYLDPGDIGAPGNLTVSEVRGLRDSGHGIGLLVKDAATSSERLRALKDELASMSRGAIVSFACADNGPELAAIASGAGFEIGQRLSEADIRGSEIESWLSLPVTAQARHDHMELRDRWEAIENAGDGLFHLWGNAADIGADEDAWAELECNLAWFCGHQDVWYCTTEELYRAFYV